MEWKSHSVSTELRVNYYVRFRGKQEQASITAQPSPSPPSQSCGTTVADLPETGYRSRGALKWTVWSTSCAEQSAVAQPWERWTGTAQGRQIPESDCFILTKMQVFLSQQNPRMKNTWVYKRIKQNTFKGKLLLYTFTFKIVSSSCDNQKAISRFGDHLQGPIFTYPWLESYISAICKAEGNCTDDPYTEFCTLFWFDWQITCPPVKVRADRSCSAGPL